MAGAGVEGDAAAASVGFDDDDVDDAEEDDVGTLTVNSKP